MARQWQAQLPQCSMQLQQIALTCKGLLPLPALAVHVAQRVESHNIGRAALQARHTCKTVRQLHCCTVCTQHRWHSRAATRASTTVQPPTPANRPLHATRAALCQRN